MKFVKRSARRVHILLLRRGYLAAGLCIAAAAILFAAVYAPAAVTVGATQRQLPIYSVERQDRKVSISFDAAWGDAKLRRSREGPSQVVCKVYILRGLWSRGARYL